MILTKKYFRIQLNKDTNNDLKCLIDYIVVDKRLSNCCIEVLNNKIKVIKRVGLDIENFSILG